MKNVTRYYERTTGGYYSNAYRMCKALGISREYYSRVNTGINTKVNIRGYEIYNVNRGLGKSYNLEVNYIYERMGEISSHSSLASILRLTGGGARYFYNKIKRCRGEGNLEIVWKRGIIIIIDKIYRQYESK